ncbi:MAG: MFS transporter [Caulobacteraceae bacterium]
MTATGTKAGGAQIAVLVVGSCLPVLGSVLVAPILPSIAKEFANLSNVGVLTPLVIAAPALFIALVSPLVGMIADRAGRKRILMFALPLYSVIGLAPIFLDSLPAIVATRFALGVAEAVIMTICTTLIGDYLDGPRRERILALQTVATAISAVVFVIVGGALGEGGWRTPFWLYSAGFVLAPLAAMLLWEPLKRDDAAAPPPEPMPWKALSAVYLLTLAGAIGFYVVPSQAAYLLAGLGVDSPSAAGGVNGAAQAAVLIGALGFTLVRRLGLPTCLGLALLLAGAGLVGLGLAKDTPQLIAAAMLNGVGSGLMLPTLLTWTMSLVSLPQRGRGAGGFTTFFFLGQFVSPLLVVAMSGHAGGPATAIIVVGAITLLLALPAIAFCRAFQGEGHGVSGSAATR